jgi:nucleotide-binding universal stress UspA family protein
MTLLPFKRILLPTDFSDPSRAAMRSALELAVHFSAKLYFLHVVTPIPVINPVAFDYLGSGLETDTVAGMNIPQYQQGVVESNRTMLKKVIEEIVPNEVKVECLVEIGDAAAVINEIANREHIDLIVMATHGLTGVPHFLLGSVTEKVARHASVPVMILRR